jgi:hypothetical protein
MTINIHLLLYVSIILYFAGLGLYLLKKQKAVFPILCAGFAVHTVYLVSRAFITGIFIPANMFDGVFFIPWCIAFLMIYKRFFSKQEADWNSLIPLLCAFAVIMIIYPKGVIPQTPKKTSLWVPLFFGPEGMAFACYFSGAWFAYLFLRNRVKSEVFHSFIIGGFMFYTIAQVTGAIWSYNGWSSTFRWGARHMFSAAIWCYFAAYLHLRFMPNWSDDMKARYALAGFFLTVLLGGGSYVNEFSFPRLGG